jgi:hypothetical protein
MNENAKTLTFVGVAAVVALIALLSGRSLQTSPDEDLRNQLLYPDFKNPRSATSLEIVKFDEKQGTIRPFKVAEVSRKGKTRWSIPSHEDYPADAKDQVAAAATALMGLKVIEKVSDNEGDQQEYGVVDPDPKMLKLGATGVGDRVLMKDKDGKELLALIVGKEVPDRPGLRYVRKIGESGIYIVEAKTDKLSNKFEDWIEPNLLQINTMDLKDLLVRDYAIRTTNRGLAIIHRGRMDVGYNDAGEPHWKMVNDEKFAVDEKSPTGGKWEPVKVPAGDVLDVAKLDQLKTALDDLKIVDVSRKPAGLSTDLKVAADFATNEDAVESLQEKGFFPAQVEDNGPAELFSNEGEIRLAMKNGVVYVLRFGQVAGAGASAKKNAKSKDKTKDDAKDQDKKGTGLNRYLFVMAEFDPALIPKPVLEAVIEPKKEAEKKPDAEKKAEAPKPGEKKPEEKKPEDKKPDAKKPEDKKPDAKKPEEKKPDPKKAEADKKAQEAERSRVEKENKRRQEEYDQQIADGKKKVAELNARFADWYYVISDDVYRKIHLGHDQLLTKKAKKSAAKGGQGMPAVDADPAHPADAPKEPGTPVGELEKLKQEGPGAE